ncbi:NUC156 family protein [Tieghemostelium lacteum]|uniref:Polynucleotide 5'-hydroxyl-kinase NOL9 n=1 Tax=Tieghemostelium lacteum TaxID=361077 RepID=A0A152A2N0_TIELA|nr:NUC156 family protein [Tieghemostelium lacteum]|eukprot:KYR00512.1 NUC156 family protein [Tieghemostelium lacteum]
MNESTNGSNKLSNFQIKTPNNLNKIIRVEENKNLLIFFNQDIIYFYGKANIRVLYGSIDIYGHNLKPTTNFYPIYAPFCSNVLSISSNSNNNNQEQNEVDTERLKIDHSEIRPISEQVNTIIQSNSKLITSIVIIGYLSDNCENSTLLSLRQRTKIENYSNIFPEINSFYPLFNIPKIQIQPLQIPRFWIEYIDNEILNNNNSSSNGNLKLITIGNKDVGKSTFNRVLLNRLLNRYPHVLYVELDTGQCEFTPSGLVSVDLIKEPLFGPTFTHMKPKPLRQYFYGDITSKTNPEYYLNLCKQVLDCCDIILKQHPNIPVLVNSNGWLKGLGLMLISEIIKYLQPTIITQLYQQPREITYKLKLSVTGDDIKQWFTENIEKSPKMFNISSANLGVGSAPFKPLPNNDWRDLMSRSYFKMESEIMTNQIPYSVEWKHYKVKILSNRVEPSQTMVSLNGQVVGLCYDPVEYEYQSRRITVKTPHWIQGQPNICECLGLALVRSIDMAASLFYLLTPLSLEQVQQSNLILKGSLDIPWDPHVAVSSKGTVIMPYLKFDILSSYGTGSSHMDRTKKKNKFYD